MPTQVRIFTMPKSLGESLNSSSLASIPRSMPDQITEDSIRTKPEHQRFTMTTISETPKEGGITFAGQDSLPKLPIPELENTCNKYLAALRPLQTPREHADTKAAVAACGHFWAQCCHSAASFFSLTWAAPAGKGGDGEGSAICGRACAGGRSRDRWQRQGRVEVGS